MKKKARSLLLLCVLWLLTGCGLLAQSPREDQREPAAEDQLNIVTTAFPPYDFARQLAGAGAKITMLLKPGGEAHTYEPTPQDMIAIENCDIFLYIGGESEDWVDRLLESVDDSSMEALALMDCVDLLDEEMVEGMYAREGEDHGGSDEHIWTDPANVVKICEKVTEVLKSVRPENAKVYEENLAAYKEQLLALDEQFRQIVDSGSRKTIIFGDRFPFRYFAHAYGLDYYAAFPGCSSESEPSVATMIYLTDKIRELHIPVVFTLEMSNEKIADVLCGETGARKLTMHSCHNVSRKEFESGETYLSLMKKNAENLREALN